MLDLEEIAGGPGDYEHRWLINTQTSEIVFRPADYGIDGHTPVDFGDLDGVCIDPLPSYVWYRDMADFTESLSSPPRTRASHQGKGVPRRFKNQLHEEHPHLLPAWHAFRDVRTSAAWCDGWATTRCSMTKRASVSRPSTQIPTFPAPAAAGESSGGHVVTEASGEVGEFVVGDIEVASCQVEERRLLLFVGNPGWQRSQVPVDVAVGLLAAQGQDVEAFDGQQVGQGAACTVHDCLEGEVFVGGEVGDSVFAMLDRRDEKVAEHGRKTAGEDNSVVISVGDVVWIVRVVGKELADEAGTAGKTEVGAGLPRNACGHTPTCTGWSA